MTPTGSVRPEPRRESGSATGSLSTALAGTAATAGLATAPAGQAADPRGFFKTGVVLQVAYYNHCGSGDVWVDVNWHGRSRLSRTRTDVTEDAVRREVRTIGRRGMLRRRVAAGLGAMVLGLVANAATIPPVHAASSGGESVARSGSACGYYTYTGNAYWGNCGSEGQVIVVVGLGGDVSECVEPGDTWLGRSLLTPVAFSTGGSC